MAWFAAQEERGYPVLVAAAPEGDVVGYSAFADWRGAWPGYRHTLEHSVHVRADRRGAGVGGRLVEALFPYAQALGKHVMIGAIDAANAASMRLHERLGFVEVAHFREVGENSTAGSTSSSCNAFSKIKLTFDPKHTAWPSIARPASGAGCSDAFASPAIAQQQLLGFRAEAHNVFRATRAILVAPVHLAPVM
jgi:hypothetical protein